MAWRNYRKPAASKYGAKKVVVDGITFDSKKEARRYLELLNLQAAGEICDLQRQVKFVLIPAQYGPEIKGPRGGRKRGQLLERECAYIADFVYREVLPFGDPSEYPMIVEDVKGMDNLPVFVIKRKLMLEKYGISIKVVKG